MMFARPVFVAILLSTVLVMSSAFSAVTRYVDAAVSASGDGTTWEMAFKTIQEGIDGAADGDTVIVAEGAYVENIQFHGKNIVLTSTDPLDPAVVESTVIDGDQAGSVVTFAGTEDETCVISGFTIRNGSASEGGGIRGRTGANRTQVSIQNNIIIGNTARNGGGLSHCNGLIANNMIFGNTADQDGGGLMWCGGVIQNNLIAGNSAVRVGGGLYACAGAVRNNTIQGNSATYGGGVNSCRGDVSNCILWGNTATTGGPQVWTSYNFAYCCIQGGNVAGAGNIADDPRFLDADGPDDDPSTFHDNDYRLSAASGCIDAGTNEDWMNGATDLDGNPRILAGDTSLTVDMGAYEYRFKIGGLTRQPEGTVELIWDSRAGKTYAIWSCMGPTTDAWTEDGTVTAKGSVATWTDAETAARRKFYRIEIK